MLKYFFIILFFFFIFGCESSKRNLYSEKEITKICLDKKKLALSPDTIIRLTKNRSDDLDIDFSLKLSSDYLFKRDPNLVYNKCVRNLSN